MSRRFQRLTRPAVRALVDGGSICEHGITATRLTDGDVRWSIGVMVDRMRIHRVIGRESEGVTREQAERAVETLRTQAREDRLSLPRGRKTRLTFAEACRDYLIRLEEGGGRQVERKRQHVEKRLLPHFRQYSFVAVPNAAVESFVASRRADGAKPSTINRELATLSHIFRRALGWKWIDPSRLPVIERLKEQAGRIVALTADECDRLLRAAIADSDPDLWLFVLLALHTAMRHGELRRLRWEHLDAERRRFFVPVAKAGAREQPLTTAATEVLVAERERRGVTEGPLFPPGPGSRSPCRHTFRKAFRRAVIAAGLDPAVIVPHVQRHTAITALIKANVDLPTVQKVSGHRTLSQVMRYAHVHANHVDEAADRLRMPVPARA